MSRNTWKRLPWGWRIFARIFTGINVLGFIYGIATRDPMHSVAHLAIQLVGVTFYLIWRFSTREVDQHVLQPDPTSELLARVQESVDRIALDVERVGEAQRFQAKLLDRESTDKT